jgi:fumarylacetoacetate (FAA) hydrolase
MKLASLDAAGRDGRLIVVNRAGSLFLDCHSVAPTLQAALDDWASLRPRLQALAARLEHRPEEGRPLDPQALLAPLPRAYEWIDASAYLHHVVLVRRARGAEPPPTLWSDPLVYQGGSGVLLGPYAPFVLPERAWGLDFEGEVALVLGDVPQGTRAADAAAHIRLVMLANDWSYRELIPAELAKGFGFFNAKPATSFSGFAVTPDELGGAWRDGRLHLPLQCRLNGALVGKAEAGVGMHFSFYQLIEHIAKTRSLTAGTILGSGTVSNDDDSVGVSCLAERRVRETLRDGKPSTPFLTHGDVVSIEMTNALGENLFGSLEARVVAP